MNTKSFEKSRAIQCKFHQLIPGGAHTYAKGDDQFPEFYAPYLVRGEGSHVWDVDGNEYIEFGSGLRAINLGHAYPAVLDAVRKQLPDGSNFARPAMIEYEVAEAMLEMVPGAEMIKFCKNGSDATTAAIKLARAYTGRDKIAICGDQPFFSIDDWFIGATKINAGIPQAIKEMTLKFKFNNLDSVRDLFDRYPGEISCFIMEIEKYQPVSREFLFGLQRLCREKGALLILDEMITGFRWHNGGAQTLYGIEPDLSTFGKAMANGFSVSALLGKREFMNRGGLYQKEERVFLLSTTHGAEHHSLAACKAVIEEYKQKDVIGYLKYQGERLKKGMLQIISENHLERYVSIIGHPACLVFGTKDNDKQPSQPFRTLFMQEIIKRGIIASNLVINYSHTDQDIDQALERINEACVVYRKALSEGIEKYLEGRPVAPVYRKFNHPQVAV